ncbi:hypothetical protein MRB53_015191 [Persea americana]|uniref:Uncharacterized protein n=1 Tax=Persea americana TaxID=3435 RepID=A0ACC2KCX5_PERAE|nr:hypothetical protein MRB53_015191 [Persea americana]
MSTFLFSSLPSTAFLHKNPNSSPLLCNFSSSSISISFSAKANPFPFRCFSAAASAVGFRAPTKTNGSDASATAELLDISKLGISEVIVSALARRGITELFPIQRAVLEPAMEGRDMIGRAITGSGKTLAFAIPILDKIIQHRSQDRRKRVPSALVLAPTRELARQVQKEFKESAPNLSSACLYGGIPIMSQARMLGLGIDIAIGTPGRIIDLVERGALNLSEVKFVVLDEADQMLNIGFQEAVECILSYLPAKRQCMLFSATMPSWVNQLSRKYLRNPLVIDLVGDSDQKLAGGISIYSVVSNASAKPNILPSLISRFGHGGKCIVFTKTKNDAEVLSRSMGSLLGSRALHGNMQQFQRDKTIAAFRDGRFNVLVATDVAARGLDIPNVDLVIHFEIPNTSEIFVHRSGRTGRAGKKGTAILIFTESQRRAVRLIERDLSCKFEELPRITDGIVNNTSITDMEKNSYGRSNDSVRRQLGRPDPFAAGRFGNNGSVRGQNYGIAYESRTQHSNKFKQHGGQFGGYESSKRGRSSENLGGRNTNFRKSRSTLSYDSDDFDSNDYSVNASASGFRRDSYSENLGGRNTQFRKSRNTSYNSDNSDSNDYSVNASASGMNSFGRRSRSVPKFQFDGIDPLNANSDDEDHLSEKKRPSSSDSGIDFKQILDSLRNHP